MFQIRRFEDSGRVIFALSGRIEEESLAELKKLLEAESGAESGTPSNGIVLNLEDVKLVHRSAVKFLVSCEARGMELRGCPAYVRVWMQGGRMQGL
jgi:hypothetical protein